MSSIIFSLRNSGNPCLGYQRHWWW
jgi:hypothetical protein